MIERMLMETQLMKNYERDTGVPFTDSLTGLFNHGFFQISLDREVKRSKRHGDPFTLALIDIDSFSHYNKHCGSVKGDRMLREISDLVMKNIRQTDLAARFSDDVLAVIFLKSSSRSSLASAERIREAVEKMSCKELTISMGLASYPKDIGDGQSLIQKAKEALIEAKLRGKNRVHFFENKKRSIDQEKPIILVVDDEPLNVKLIEAVLVSENYKVVKAFNGEDALGIVKKADVDLVLLDLMMPNMDGYEVCRRLKESEDTRLIPVVMLTALDDIESKIKGIEAGADDFLSKPANNVELLARAKSLIKLKRLNNNLIGIESVLFSMANAVEAKDAYTQGHVERVSNRAMTLGTKMGLSAREIEALKFGGALHDVGKVGVSIDILNKPGPLNADEFEIMKSHADIGYKICLPLKKNLGLALDIIRHHHEKLDGSGYPDGLKGEEIPMVARIMAVMDIYDALITDRPYRKGMSREKAFGILREEALEGKLDNKVVELFIETIS
jgi:putative two-component system response regulator